MIQAKETKDATSEAKDATIATSTGTTATDATTGMATDPTNGHNDDNGNECTCHDFIDFLAETAKRASWARDRQARYQADGVCDCPEHGANHFEAFYIPNRRGGLDYSGVNQNGEFVQGGLIV